MLRPDMDRQPRVNIYCSGFMRMLAPRRGRRGYGLCWAGLAMMSGGGDEGGAGRYEKNTFGRGRLRESWRKLKRSNIKGSMTDLGNSLGESAARFGGSVANVTVGNVNVGNVTRSAKRAANSLAAATGEAVDRLKGVLVGVLDANRRSVEHVGANWVSALKLLKKRLNKGKAKKFRDVCVDMVGKQQKSVYTTLGADGQRRLKEEFYLTPKTLALIQRDYLKQKTTFEHAQQRALAAGFDPRDVLPLMTLPNKSNLCYANTLVQALRTIILPTTGRLLCTKQPVTRKASARDGTQVPERGLNINRALLATILGLTEVETFCEALKYPTDQQHDIADAIYEMHEANVPLLDEMLWERTVHTECNDCDVPDKTTWIPFRLDSLTKSDLKEVMQTPCPLDKEKSHNEIVTWTVPKFVLQQFDHFQMRTIPLGKIRKGLTEAGYKNTMALVRKLYNQRMTHYREQKIRINLSNFFWPDEWPHARSQEAEWLDRADRVLVAIRNLPSDVRQMLLADEVYEYIRTKDRRQPVKLRLKERIVIGDTPMRLRAVMVHVGVDGRGHYYTLRRYGDYIISLNDAQVDTRARAVDGFILMNQETPHFLLYEQESNIELERAQREKEAREKAAAEATANVAATEALLAETPPAEVPTLQPPPRKARTAEVGDLLNSGNEFYASADTVGSIDVRYGSVDDLLGLNEDRSNIERGLVDDLLGFNDRVGRPSIERGYGSVDNLLSLNDDVGLGHASAVKQYNSVDDLLAMNDDVGSIDWSPGPWQEQFDTVYDSNELEVVTVDEIPADKRAVETR
ncbi:hypothetical protein GNI_105720 [Gregarina niphandrodes]|uniref:Ubiquitin carboxyl-terminal hydrolase n=1 Tax=Gregarina niphandrodes TaxID=110365 RepID=A0A023B421_GRENI|nr:hypothetical protein GNI_105720 [Gregarina niphandrodes]EZG56112.1 hypothetical protein GNI_105720 [Gregarina niphandrodes]|eukprot:XP_011131345.1 hypothetical protein GNI_105720 [Gregarina niphandrodes]